MLRGDLCFWELGARAGIETLLRVPRPDYAERVSLKREIKLKFGGEVRRDGAARYK